MPRALRALPPRDVERFNRETIAHYDESAQAFWKGTKDHDVSQNVEALLRHVRGEPPLAILDLGCGPGRDLVTFRDLGHHPIGLDASARFVAMAQKHSGCEVWHQDLLALDLPPSRFDGIFANAVLFHVPSQELSRVLGDLHRALKGDGVLFCSNPRGPDLEGVQGDRYGAYMTLETWRLYVTEAGFTELEHYYRPTGRHISQQPWLATVWRKPL
jgi:SAM-dependent methyltransferase